MNNGIVQNIKALQNLPPTWSVASYANTVKDHSSGNTKIPKSAFLNSGQYAIVDQGKKLLAGYTNDQKLLVKSAPPYIIFGDHTRIFKYIDTQFAMGADGTKVLKAQDSHIASEKFLYYFFLTLNIPDTGYNRHYKHLKSVQIPLPPLDEQQKIAAILDAADQLRQKDQQLIEHYTQLGQSLFLEMFGDPLKGDAHMLGNNIEVLGGYAFKSSDFVSTGIPLVKIGTVNKGYFDTANFSFLPSSFAGKYAKWLVRDGDILMSLTGTVGKDDYGNVELATKDYPQYFLNQRVAKISPANKSYLPGFLFGLLSHAKTKKELTKISRGVRQANISNKDLLALKMIKPTIRKQQKYIDAVKLVEHQKQQAQTNLKNSEALFNSLLQRAFKGELTG